jgi:hypothetical protein
VPDTTVIASLETHAGAAEVVELLRTNGIECALEEPAVGARLETTGVLPIEAIGGAGMCYEVLVAKGDEARAREALQGAFASEWFLRAPDGGRYHSFEAATPAVLRRYVSDCPETDEFALQTVRYLADLLEREHRPTVYEAFHERHFLRHRERLVEARSLDDWARSCGCYHEHTPQEQ